MDYDEYDFDEVDEYDDYDLLDDCGMMANGQCLKAGSEECDWECGRACDWDGWVPDECPSIIQRVWMEIKWPFIRASRWIASLVPERCPECGKRPCEGNHDCIPF